MIGVPNVRGRRGCPTRDRERPVGERLWRQLAFAGCRDCFGELFGDLKERFLVDVLGDGYEQPVLGVRRHADVVVLVFGYLLGIHVDGGVHQRELL